ncbi:hypothetical protein [Amphibacillus jilinensis]|uniref:hypothetical protein n=1 Tax=Amphibacillus jilinensis TaxID=1216008 RepID=UPI00031162C0|nr:hypothetical protein [Amphibacillus jilinensis]
MKKIALLFLSLFVIHFIAIRYLLHDQSTLINVVVISLISGIIGYIFSRYDNKGSK